MTWIITRDKYLNDEEVKSLIKTCSNAAVLAEAKGNWLPIRDWMIIDLALNTGLRVNEICKLKINDLHIEYRQSFLIVQSGKGNKPRIVKLGRQLKAHLKKYLQQRKSDSVYLYESSRGNVMNISAMQKIFKKKAGKAGLPEHYSIHSLRHTYAIRLYKASDYNLRLVQKMLGHSSIQTTKVYSDVLDDAVNNIEKP